MSKKNEFKILIFIMALIITFGLAMGGNYLHARYNIENPLLAQIKDLPGVESITIEKKDDLYLLQVSLGKVDNLQEEYKQLDELVRDKLGQEKYQILVEEATAGNWILFIIRFSPLSTRPWLITNLYGCRNR